MSRAVPVFVPHWNRAESCARTVAALHGQTIAVEIVILDNASRVEERTKLAELLGDTATLRQMERNLGFGPALNVGLREWLAAGTDEFAVLAAHDALPEPHCVERLLDVLRARPDIGIASAVSGYPHIARHTGLRGPYLPHHAVGTGFEAQDFPHGTLLAVRRDCLAQIGLFDERFFAYGCEIEIGLRARRAGWVVGAVWGATVENPERGVPSATASYLQVRNALLISREESGAGWALVRTAITLANTLRLAAWPPARPQAFTVGGRLRAVRDAWIGRFGPPPVSVSGSIWGSNP